MRSRLLCLALAILFLGLASGCGNDKPSDKAPGPGYGDKATQDASGRGNQKRSPALNVKPD
jgi:hypothetical protein